MDSRAQRPKIRKHYPQQITPGISIGGMVLMFDYAQVAGVAPAFRAGVARFFRYTYIWFVNTHICICVRRYNCI